MGANPIRVLLISTHPVQYAVPLYALYAQDPRLDATVAYCSMRGAVPAKDPEFEIEYSWDIPTLEGYSWIHPPNRGMTSRPDSFWHLINPGIWKIVRSGRYDVVVCFGHRAATFWIASLAARLSGSVLVFTSDAHSYATRARQRLKERIKRIVFPVLYRVPEAVLAPSSRTVRFLRDEVGVEKVSLVPYVVNNEFFRTRAASADREAIRKRWRVEPGRTVVGFCGKLATWKRPFDLLDAAAEIPDVHVVYAGDGPLMSSLKEQARALDMSDRVTFLGFVNQTPLPDFYAGSDVLVLPSEYEPFGLVVNEAFASGVPAVVSDACGVADDLIIDDRTGFTYSCGDVERLKELLARLASDHDLVARLGREAQTAIASWGPLENVKRFVEACDALVPAHSDR